MSTASRDQPGPRTRGARSRGLGGAVIGAARACARRAQICPVLAILAAAFIASPAAAADSATPDAADQSETRFWLNTPEPHYRSEWGLLDVDRGSGSTQPRWEIADSLTGDWGGERTRIQKDYGVTLLGNYTAEVAGNATGGLRRAVQYAHNVDLTLLADLERLARFPGTYFVVSASERAGASTSKGDIGNFFAVQQIFGPTETFRLVQLAIGQRFAGGLLDVALGRLVTTEDFLASPLYCNSQNLAICPSPIPLFTNVSFGVYPTASWGARGRYRPHQALTISAATYNMSPQLKESRYHGADFTIRSDSGWGEIGELEFAPYRLENPSGVLRHPGHYKVGGYYDSEPLVEFRTGDRRRGTWGVYLGLDQMLYREKTDTAEGLTAFATFVYAPPDVNKTEIFAGWGLVYQGLIPGRDLDITGLYGAWGRFSSALGASQRAAGRAPENYELIVELNYRWNVLAWFYLQPDVQGVINPGGTGEIQDALVFALQFGVPF